MAFSKFRANSPDLMSESSLMEMEVSPARGILRRQNAVDLSTKGYNPPVEDITPPASPDKENLPPFTQKDPQDELTPDTPFVDNSAAEELHCLLLKKNKIESLMAVCEEGDDTNKLFQDQLDLVKEEIKNLMSGDDMKDHRTPRRRKRDVIKPKITKEATPATVANCPPLEKEKGATKKDPKKSHVVRKVPTDFKVVNLVKKKKRFDGMTFKLDDSFTVCAKEIHFNKGQNSMEAITIERHFTVKHPNNDGAMIPKISPMNISRKLLDGLITAVRAIVKSKEVDIESMPPPIPGRDGIFDLSYMTKGVYTTDRFVIDPMLSLQVEEIQFSNNRGTGVFDVLAITKELNSLDKNSKKNKTFVQQIPVRLLPGLLRALTTIAKYTRETEKTLDAANNVTETPVAAE